MSSYNTKNYTEQSGDRTVIGGILEFTEEAEVLNFPGGTITPVANVADSKAEDVETLVKDYNSLLAALRNAGILKKK